MGRETGAVNCRTLGACVPWILLACWLGAAAAGFQAFGMLSRATASDAERIRSTEAWFHAAAAPGAPTLVLVAGKPCACERWEKEIAALKTRRPEARVMVVDAAEAPPAAQGLAMVFSAQGRLRYVGPLVDASNCGGAGRLAEQALSLTPPGDDEAVYWNPTPACRCIRTQNSNTAIRS
jgi:hypothetical protein